MNVPGLDRWLIGSELGRGGMGVVYRAEDRQTGEPCAVKILLLGVDAGPDAVALVEREVECSRSLVHPHIVRTYASGRVQDAMFLVMELCRFGSLASWVAEHGPLKADEAVPLMVDVLAGLHHAHSVSMTITNAGGERVDVVGLVHRDIKPSNILLAGTGRLAKICDFGLAKAYQLAGLSGLTPTGTSGGTPAFMPRQQVIDFKYATPAVDVWAAAASLYFALTGHTPRDFPSDRDPWLTAWRTRPIPIADRNVPVPARLARLLDEALMDDPGLRFATALEFREALLTR